MLLVFTVQAQIPVPCTNPRIRKEFRQVQQEGGWPLVVEGFQKLKYSGRLSEFSAKHYLERNHIHGTMEFYTWHRRFIYELETELQQVTNSNVTLPFIDFALEAEMYSGQIERSIALTEYFYGDAERDGQCLKGQIYNGTFFLRSDFNLGQCAYRQRENTVEMHGWAAADMAMYYGTFYDDFSNQIENGIHSYPHLRIGGVMGTQHSPMDPLFYGHHSFIDMLLVNRQYLHESFENDRGIPDFSFSIMGDTITHQQVYQMDDMCVTYERYEGSSSRVLAKRQENDSDIPEYTKYSKEEKEAYNKKLSDHYSALKDKIKQNETENGLKMITNFYPNSYMPINNHPPREVLERLGMNPDRYYEVNEGLDAQKVQLAKFGNYVVKNVLDSIQDTLSSNSINIKWIGYILFMVLQ